MSSRAVGHNRIISEDGFALLDVVIAIVVLMIVLLPVAYLLSTTNKTVAANQFRLTAQSVAASWLQQEQTAASQSTTGPPSISSPGGTAASPTWPSAATQEVVGNITYQVYLAGGWCAYSGLQWANGQADSSTTTSTNVPPPPLAYFVAAKIKWGPSASNPTLAGQNNGSVVEYSSLQTQPTWTVTLTGPPTSSASVLTLSSTSGIQDNICPLGLK